MDLCKTLLGQCLHAARGLNDQNNEWHNLMSPHPQTPSLECCGEKFVCQLWLFRIIFKRTSPGNSCIWIFRKVIVRLFRLHFLLQPTSSSSVFFKFKSFFMDDICYRWSGVLLDLPCVVWDIILPKKQKQNSSIQMEWFLRIHDVSILFLLFSSSCFQIVPRAHDNILKTISMHIRPQEIPETL